VLPALALVMKSSDTVVALKVGRWARQYGFFSKVSIERGVRLIPHVVHLMHAVWYLAYKSPQSFAKGEEQLPGT
jgi:hypothetical protein